MSNKLEQYREKEEQNLRNFYDEIGKNVEMGLRENFFLQLLNFKIALVEEKEAKGASKSRGLRISALIMSTLATVVLGLRFGGYPGWLQWQSDIALTLTGGVTLLAAIATFLDVDSYRLHVRIMLEKLKILRYRYVYLLSTSPKTHLPHPPLQKSGIKILVGEQLDNISVYRLQV